MLEFRVKNVVPPGGQYFFEVHGVPLVWPTRTGLMSAVRDAYDFCKKEVPENIDALVEDFMCRRLPEGFCTGCDDGKPRARVITMQGLRRDTERLVTRSTITPPVRAKFNAETCNQCPKNNRAMCPTCSGVNAWASRRVGRPNTPAAYNWLGVCEVDGTALAAKVNLTGIPVGEHPDNCWVKEQVDE
jgi:hypothetical protein